MQRAFPSDAAPLGTRPAEDCLVVNVSRPETPSAGSIGVAFGGRRYPGYRPEALAAPRALPRNRS